MLIQDLNKIPKIEIITKLEKIKTVLFDLDGTLVDTERLHAEALHLTLKKIIPTSTYSISDLEDKFQGMSDSDVFIQLDQKKVGLSEFLDLKNNYFIEIIRAKNDILESDVLALLESIKENKLNLGLVTASERKITEALLNQVGISSIFDIVICRDDLEQSKPDPLPYLTAIKKLKSTAQETIIFEDSITGLAAAKASGAKYFKVSWFTDA